MRVSPLAMATTAIAVVSLFSTACITVVDPVDPPAAVHLHEPLFDVIEIEGLTTREREVVARARVRGAVAGGAIVYKTFDSDELLHALRYALEDSNVVGGVADAASCRIEGRVHDAGSGNLTRAWNWLMALSLLGFAGSPYFGSADAAVQLRLYHADRFIETYSGTGKARWRVHRLLHFGRPHPPREATDAARVSALQRSVAALAVGGGHPCRSSGAVGE